jgi:hypothetical protein
MVVIGEAQRERNAELKQREIHKNLEMNKEGMKNKSILEENSE